MGVKLLHFPVFLRCFKGIHRRTVESPEQFDEFRRTVIAPAKTRVLALINIVGKGMVGEPYESDVEDMDPAKTADAILRNKEVIVGIKTAHFGKPGWAAIRSPAGPPRRPSRSTTRN